jgi:hypothetical protein
VFELVVHPADLAAHQLREQICSVRRAVRRKQRDEAKRSAKMGIWATG